MVSTLSLSLVFLHLALQSFCYGECAFNIFRYPLTRVERKYASISENERLRLKEDTRDMFYFGYDSYMKYAYPKDELNPIYCSGRGPDYDNPSNININDILGDYSLTLIDALDTLAILGDAEEFRKAVKLVIENVSFDKNSTVQVFEANIR
ncbi:hypothetical protein OTU49_013330 [Cherax quadricarinatus]|uniref:alpha-1,2-Mannosidase n=2 Tax=Cherax quadricarinatus TaxID=27406 RepID=A0AAW0YHF8_CHEQU